MKLAKSPGREGAHCALRPPFDHAGKPLTLRIGSIPFFLASERTRESDAGQR
jgi:hypothetical protein